MLVELIKGVKQRVRPEKCWLTVKKCLC